MALIEFIQGHPKIDNIASPGHKISGALFLPGKLTWLLFVLYLYANGHKGCEGL